MKAVNTMLVSFQKLYVHDEHHLILEVQCAIKGVASSTNLQGSPNCSTPYEESHLCIGWYSLTTMYFVTGYNNIAYGWISWTLTIHKKWNTYPQCVTFSLNTLLTHFMANVVMNDVTKRIRGPLAMLDCSEKITFSGRLQVHIELMWWGYVWMALPYPSQEYQ